MLERPDVVNDTIISVLAEVQQGKRSRKFRRSRDRKAEGAGEEGALGVA
jgi:hypothetical protein